MDEAVAGRPRGAGRLLGRPDAGQGGQAAWTSSRSICSSLEYAAAMAERPLGQLARPRRGRHGRDLRRRCCCAACTCGISQRGPLASLTRLIVLLLLAIATVAVARWASAERLARRTRARAAVRHDDGHRLPAGAGPAACRRDGDDRGAGRRARPAGVPAADGRRPPPPCSTWDAFAPAAS